MVPTGYLTLHVVFQRAIVVEVCHTCSTVRAGFSSVVNSGYLVNVVTEILFIFNIDVHY